MYSKTDSLPQNTFKCRICHFHSICEERHIRHVGSVHAVLSRKLSSFLIREPLDTLALQDRCWLMNYWLHKVGW